MNTTSHRLDELETYRDLLKNRLESEVPLKHLKHPVEFKAYLKNELRLVTQKIEKAKQI